MKTISQIQKIKIRLERYGQVNNLWAINNGMWRLGSIICELRKQGMKIDGEYLPTADGKQSKIYNYRLVK